MRGPDPPARCHDVGNRFNAFDRKQLSRRRGRTPIGQIYKLSLRERFVFAIKSLRQVHTRGWSQVFDLPRSRLSKHAEDMNLILRCPSTVCDTHHLTVDVSSLRLTCNHRLARVTRSITAKTFRRGQYMPPIICCGVLSYGFGLPVRP